eukprot:9611209-Alexandrium_andersonii.AAC.1
MASPIALQGSCPWEIRAVKGHRLCMRLPLAASNSFSCQRTHRQHRFARAGGPRAENVGLAQLLLCRAMGLHLLHTRGAVLGGRWGSGS